MADSSESGIIQKEIIKDLQEMNKRKQGLVKSVLASEGSAVLDAGKESVKEAVVAGARNAVMS